jgi:hypothetical protein
MSNPDLLRYLTARETGEVATPSIIQKAIDGPPIEETPPPVERQISIPKPVLPENAVFRSGRREQASRRRKLDHQNRGDRSPQNHGRR